MASKIEVGNIPLDFDPGDLRWREVVAMISRRFSNHAALREQLLDRLEERRLELAGGCDFAAACLEGDPQEACRRCWLAKYRLREAALEASERAYQRWLARAAIRRAKKEREG